MITDFFTKTATLNRLSSTSKTNRTFTFNSNPKVSEPQPKAEKDILEGVTVTRYNIYTEFGTDVIQNDELVIDSFKYKVEEVMPMQVRNLEFLKLLTVRD